MAEFFWRGAYSCPCVYFVLPSCQALTCVFKKERNIHTQQSRQHEKCIEPHTFPGRSKEQIAEMTRDACYCKLTLARAAAQRTCSVSHKNPIFRASLFRGTSSITLTAPLRFDSLSLLRHLTTDIPSFRENRKTALNRHVMTASHLTEARLRQHLSTALQARASHRRSYSDQALLLLAELPPLPRQAPRCFRSRGHASTQPWSS